MTRVCLVGDEGVTLRADLLAYETAREVLSSYEPSEPYANTLCVETISLGAAVSLLNDLNWYLVRLVDDALVLEPSVSADEWLSRDLATAIRNEAVDPADTGEFLEVYGVVEPDRSGDSDPDGDSSGDPGPPDDASSSGGSGGSGEIDGSREGGDPDADGAGTRADEPQFGGPPRLVEPMFVRRVGEEVPDYDLRDVDGTLVVRVTPDEFGRG